MFIPYDTDAPIYHYPIATGAIIFTNIAIFIGLLAEGSSHTEVGSLARDLCLTFGFSFRPWQWVTSTFMHADVVHLLGNMLALWPFGLIVEGKIGWARFLAIYLGMGATQGFVEQLLMLFADGGYALGASGVIFAMIAIGMLWAPQDEMSCVTFILYRPFFFDSSVLTVAAMMIGIQVVVQLFIGLSMSSQLLHLIGVGVGLPVGIVMLKRGWVDCEGRDLFSVYTDRPSDEAKVKSEEEEAAKQLLEQAHRTKLAGGTIQPDAVPPAPVTTPTPLPLPPLQPTFDEPTAPLPAHEADLEPIRAAIAADDPDRAFAAYEEYASDLLNWPLPERELVKIVSSFHKQKKWRQSVPAMVRYLENFSERATAMRLKLAHVLIDVEKRPRQALYVLDKLDVFSLSEKESQTLAKMQAKAEKAKGVIADEPPPEEW